MFTPDHPLPHHRVRDDIRMILLTIAAILFCIVACIALSFVASLSTVGGPFALMAMHAPIIHQRIDVGDFNRNPAERL